MRAILTTIISAKPVHTLISPFMASLEKLEGRQCIRLSTKQDNVR